MDNEKTLGFGAFCAKVMAAVPRATDRERRDLARELMDHLEDHAAALEETGYNAKEARDRAVESMGDPAEIGAALNEQLSPFWLILHRVSTALLFLTFLHFLASTSVFYLVGSNLEARFAPNKNDTGPKEGYIQQLVDVRADVSGDTLRVYRVDLSPEQNAASIRYCIYDPDPFGLVADNAIHYVRAQGADGAWENYRGGGGGNAAVWRSEIRDVPVVPGQETIALRYDRFGEHVILDVPLDWEVTP